jgi:hypothetical protein
MEEKLEVAKQAALLLHSDAVDIKFVETHKTGEEEFVGSRRGLVGKLTITLNPNGTRAAVEWRSRQRNGSTDYRVFRVDGIPTTDETTSPSPG